MSDPEFHDEIERDAFRRGEEAMRERAAKLVRNQARGEGFMSIQLMLRRLAKKIEALPIEEETGND